MFIQCDCSRGPKPSTPGPNSPNTPIGATPITEDMIQFAKEWPGPYQGDFLADMLHKLKENPNSANVNEQDKSGGGMTALHYAAIFGNEPIVKALLDRGATASIQDTIDHGLPLHYAVQHKHFEIAKLLLDKGDANDLKVKYAWGRTPLYLAAEEGDLKIFTLLVDKGADMYEQDGYGLTPLHIAARQGHVDIVIYAC